MSRYKMIMDIWGREKNGTKGNVMRNNGTFSVIGEICKIHYIKGVELIV